MCLSNSSRGRDRSAPALLRHQPSTRMIQTTNATTTPIATISTASWRPRDGGAATGIRRRLWPRTGDNRSPSSFRAGTFDPTVETGRRDGNPDSSLGKGCWEMVPSHHALPPGARLHATMVTSPRSACHSTVDPGSIISQELTNNRPRPRTHGRMAFSVPFTGLAAPGV